jgi:hypothetical protein
MNLSNQTNDLNLFSGVETKLMIITPEKAANWLKYKNNRNRKLSKFHVSFLAKQIKAGKWMQNGESIKFDKDGNLLDGQHRLSACVAANAPIVTLVTTGLSKESFTTIDTGKKRHAGDVLSIHDIKNPNNVSGASRYVLNYKSGTYSKNNSSNNPTNQDVLEFVKNTNISKVVEDALSIYRKSARNLTVKMIAGLMFIFLETSSQDDVRIFFEKVCIGLGLSDSEPEFALKRVLDKDKIAKRKMTQREKSALIIKAWNASKKGKKVKVLLFRKDGNFPKPL